MKLYNQTVILASTSPPPRERPETTVFVMVDSVGKRRQCSCVILEELVGRELRLVEGEGNNSAPSVFAGTACRRNGKVKKTDIPHASQQTGEIMPQFSTVVLVKDTRFGIARPRNVLRAQRAERDGDTKRCLKGTESKLFVCCAVDQKSEK